VALRGLTEMLATFHASDERVYQLPTIVRFLHQLPFPNLGSYPSAQTPLFHLIMAIAAQLSGGIHLWLLRGLNVGVSYLAVIVLYRLLKRRGLALSESCALALLVGLSPYYFGASFLLLTDNLAILFALLAIWQLEAYRTERSASRYVRFSCCLAAAVLTRQSMVWLAPLGVFYLVASRLGLRLLLVGIASTAAALLPLGLLVLTWHGLVPRGADVASCGLCKKGQGLGALVSLRPVLFTLALVGLYAVAVYGPFALATRPRPKRAMLAAAAAAAVAAAVALLASEMARTGVVDAGYLWQLSTVGPKLAGSSWLFWLLTPLGAAAAVALIARAPDRLLSAGFAICFLVASLGVNLVFQKYFDPFALLLVCFAARPGDFTSAFRYIGVVVLACAFAVYALVFV